MKRSSNKERPAKPAAARDQGQTVTIRGQETRLTLLESAESILLGEGVQGLTFRRIGQVAGINPTLVTYHFGNVSGLLAELCEDNLRRVTDPWADEQLRAHDALNLQGMLDLWLSCLLTPAAFTQTGRAVTVLEEAAAFDDAELRAKLRGATGDFNAAVLRALQTELPNFSESELLARMRLITAATRGPGSRLWDFDFAGNLPASGQSRFLLHFAEDVLLAGATDD